MRYIAEQCREEGGFLVSSVRNNYRLKPGEVFLDNEFEKILSGHFTGVGEMHKIKERGKLSSLFRKLQGVVPDLREDFREIDEVVDSLSKSILDAIAAEARRLKKEGITHKGLSVTIRRRIIERLR